MYSLLKPIHGGLSVLISEVEGHIYKDNKFYYNLITWLFFVDLSNMYSLLKPIHGGLSV